MTTAFITGATSGIGYSLAKQLAAQGYSLVLVGRDNIKLEQMRKDVPNVRHTIKADLSQPGGVEQVISDLDSLDISIDVAINNAGFGLHGKHIDMNEDDIQSMLTLNVVALTKLSSYFAKKMGAAGRGAIMNVASTAAYQPQPYMAAYAATKAFVSSFTEGLAVELKPLGVKVMCLSPGRTDTQFFTFDGKDEAKHGKGTFSVKHRASPDDVARLGLKALFAGKIRKITFFDNQFLVFLNRIFPRNTVLSLYKKAMNDI